jgi:hypothetical protein
MELTARTARFLAPTDALLVAPDGSRCQRFVAGESQLVHESLWGVAVQAGLMPEKPEAIDDAPKADAPPPKKRSTEEITADQVLEAVKTLIVRGDPKDFTQLGKPRAASVKKLVDCHFTTADVQRAFEQAMFEVEQNGDESTEHSESSSSDTE